MAGFHLEPRHDGTHPRRARPVRPTPVPRLGEHPRPARGAAAYAPYAFTWLLVYQRLHAGAFLAAVLKCIEAKKGDARHIASWYIDAKNATFFV